MVKGSAAPHLTPHPRRGSPLRVAIECLRSNRLQPLFVADESQRIAILSHLRCVDAALPSPDVQLVSITSTRLDVFSYDEALGKRH